MGMEYIDLHHIKSTKRYETSEIPIEVVLQNCSAFSFRQPTKIFAYLFFQLKIITDRR